ncbi:MAG TPA: sugar ABC transporter ATP-binding protein [Steroidobacteraceae bacterium]|jgi:ribose transport system ATP-binding protein
MASQTPLGPFLEVGRLCKRFGSTVALDQVSARFFSGKIHCVLGENGAGKSTLGKIIGGVHAKDAGEILIDGKEVRLGTVGRARQLGIAIVFQELSLVADLSVRANLLLGTEPHSHPFAGLRRASERRNVIAALAALDVRVDPEERVGDLPIATQQLLEVAKAFIRRPRMIVLDEPTAMLNESEKRKLYAVLSKLREDGTALALITHHLDDVEAVADHVSIMRDGRLVESMELSGSHDRHAVAEKLSGAALQVSGRRSAPEAAIGQEPFLRIEGLTDPLGKPSMLSVRRGEIAALYGVVGSGAESVSNALFGLRRTPHIRIVIDGQRAQIATPVQARKLGFGYLPTGRASNGILPSRSIRENLNLPLLSRYSRAGILDRNREAAGTNRQLKTGAVKYRDADDSILLLSGGNQQKVLVARVLSMASSLLILEDPTAGVDMAARHQILNAIRSRAAEGISVILLSSDLHETIELADTIYTMYAGAIVTRYSSPQPGDSAAIVADVIGHNVAANAPGVRPGRPDSSLLAIPGAE